MTLVAPDHISSGTGRLDRQESARQQGAISGKYTFEVGDVIYSKIRPYLRKVFHADFPGLCSAEMYPLRAQPSIFSRFLLHLLLGEHFSRFAEIVSMRSGFPKINRSELGEYTAAVPPLPEQRQIAEILDTLDEAIRKTEAIIAKLEQIKQGLLHDLLTRGIDDNGELRDPERHPDQFKDSPLGRIPKAWGIVRAEAFCTSIADGTHDTPKPAATGFPLVTSKNLKGGRIDWSSCYAVSELDYTEVRRRSWVEPGDILFGMIGTIGNPVVLDETETEIAPKNVGIFRLGGDLQRGRFLEAILGSRLVTLQLDAAMAGSTQKFVGLGTLRRLLLPQLSDGEARQIIGVLETATERIRVEEQQASKLSLLKQGLMGDLLTGRVRVTPLLVDAPA